MAIAIIPQNYDPKTQSNQEGWLSMSEADEMICKHFGVKPDPKYYYKGWFDNFICFDWNNTKRYHAPKAESVYVYEKAEYALMQYFNVFTRYEKFEDIPQYHQFVTEQIKPLIDAIYDNGYKICSLDLS